MNYLGKNENQTFGQTISNEKIFLKDFNLGKKSKFCQSGFKLLMYKEKEVFLIL